MGVKNIILNLMVGIVLLSGSTMLFGADDPLKNALAQMDQGKFQEAASELEKLNKEHEANGHILYNLGTAYYKQGKIGQAMAAFLAARDLRPRDPDVKENIRLVSQKITDKLETKISQSWWLSAMFWIQWFTVKEMIYLGAVFFTLGTLSATLYLRSRSQTIWIVTWSGGWLLGCAIFVSAVFSQQWQMPWGAVVAKQAEVRSGPGEGNTVVFKLGEGAPFMLKDQQGPWLSVLLSDGKIGWVHSSDARVYLSL